MKTILLTFILAILSIISITAQKATITFKSDKDVSVFIAKPIDGAYNPYIYSDSLILSRNKSIDYMVNVDDFAFLKCLFSDGYRCDILLLPNSHQNIEYRNNMIHFEGQNAIGQFYLHNSFQRLGLGYYFLKMDSIFNLNVTDKICFDEIDNSIENTLMKPCINYLDQVEIENQISDTFSKLSYKDIQYAFYW